MTHLRTPLLVIAAALTVSTGNLVHAQTPVDANPVPAPTTSPATPSTINTPPTGDQVAPAPAPPSVTITPVNPPPANVAPTPVVTAPVSPTPATSSSSLTIAARDSRTLNPMLIPTDSDLQAALDDGRSFGATKQDFIDLLSPARRSFDFRKGGLLGEKRRSASVAVWITPDIEARWRGFLESRTFADQAKRDADFATMQQEVISPQRSLVYVVEIGGLISAHSDPTQQELDAAAASLSGTRFVLSDDRGNNYNPLSVATVPHLVRRQDFYDALSAGPDRLGPTAFSEPSADSRNLVLRRKPYSDYAAFYIVSFDAFNPDGGARINRDVHTVTLRIITPQEAKYAVFEVAKMP
jgi:hypothetical protein